MERFELKLLRDCGDERSDMCVCEATKDVPFEIKRFFYDFNTLDENACRANHANRNSQFAFICMNGSCEIEVDDGENKKTFLMDDPHKILVIDKLVWKVMKKFSKDSVLFVVSDCYYDKKEYIYDYSEFIRIVKSLN